MQGGGIVGNGYILMRVNYFFDKYYNLMEPENKYSEQIEHIYSAFDPRVNEYISSLLHKCKTLDFIKLLTQLNDPSTPISNLGFQAWSQFARMLIRTASQKKSKDAA